jgi:zinc-finger of transposase IS204/IS1001/IS1096/IS1165
MIDATELVRTVFSGLSALVIEGVEDAGEAICVRARTRDGTVACPDCGAETARVHGYHERTAADVPADGRRVLVRVRVRRMRCPVPGCPRQTFREQVPGVLDRYQRRTTRLTGQVSVVAGELAGRAGTRLLPALGILVSRDTALRVLLRIPLPVAGTPRVLGTTLRCAAAWSTRLCSSTRRRAAALTCCRAAPLTWWRSGCAIIPACRWCAATGRAPTARRSAARCPARSRSATAEVPQIFRTWDPIGFSPERTGSSAGETEALHSGVQGAGRQGSGRLLAAANDSRGGAGTRYQRYHARAMPLN